MSNNNNKNNGSSANNSRKISSTSAGGGDSKRPRTSIACIRCHHKKVRCDGARPNCSRCHATNKLCAYPPCRRSRNTQPTIADPFIDDLSQLEARIHSIETEQKALRLQLNSFVSTQQVDDKMAKLEHETQDSRSILAKLRLMREQRISKSKREVKRQRQSNNNNSKKAAAVFHHHHLHHHHRQHHHQEDEDEEVPSQVVATDNDNMDNNAAAAWSNMNVWTTVSAVAATSCMLPLSSSSDAWSTTEAVHPYMIAPEHEQQHQQQLVTISTTDIQLPSPLSSPQDALMYPPQMYASNSTSTVASDTPPEQQQQHHMLDQDPALFMGIPTSSLAFQYGGFDTPCTTNDIANSWTVPPF